MAHKYFKDKPITLAVQDIYIRQKCPGFMRRKCGRGYRWIGKLQPTPLSVEYEVEIEYAIGCSPKAYVLSPKLHSYSEKIEIPHIYKDGDDPKPCLFLPYNREWHGNRLIAETIIPWLSLWLFFYEIWLSTGEWLGEGVHPEPKNEDTENNI
jgi:hypothetical protein